MDDTSDLKAFAERLRKLRGGRPMYIMSELCGLSPDVLRRYEAGQAAPTAESLAKIAKCFDVSMDWLWMGKNF